MGDEGVGLLERAVVEEQVEPLARRQLAPRVLLLDAPLPAAEPRLGLAPAQVGDRRRDLRRGRCWCGTGPGLGGSDDREAEHAAAATTRRPGRCAAPDDQARGLIEPADGADLVGAGLDAVGCAVIGPQRQDWSSGEGWTEPGVV